MAVLKCAILSLVVCIGAGLASQKPNLIFLILDDQDSQLGSGLDVMPNYVARFIDGGATARNAFVGTPKCCPSRTSLLSGRFAHNLNDNTLGWCGDFIAQGLYNETFIANIKVSRCPFIGLRPSSTLTRSAECWICNDVGGQDCQLHGTDVRR